MSSIHRSWLPQRPVGLFPSSRQAGGALVAAAGAALGLGLGRTLGEAYYLSLGWLVSALGASLAALGFALLALLVWRRLDRDKERGLGSAAVFIPLFLSAGYLLHDQIDLRRATIWILGGVLLAAVLAALQQGLQIQVNRSNRERRRERGLIALLLIVTLGVYSSTLGRTVGRADSFEFQVLAGKLGIAHPTGYPLYLLLGKLFTLLPLGSIAFRVNLLSAACATGATLLVYAVLRRLLPERHPANPAVLAFLGALAFALSPTFWSQAVEAEVYALNGLFVAWTLWVLVTTLGSQSARRQVNSLVPGLFLALGLSMANHLTTLILFPSVALALLLGRPRLGWKRWLGAVLLFAAGLMLYLYLPLRWPAVHDGALMTWREFVDWVIGGRFQGALQLAAWRTDLARYGIVGRLVLDQWGWIGVAMALVGLLWLAYTRWRIALVTAVTWLGYAFYALSYYVPDISVFVIPAHLVMAIWMGCGVGAVARLARRAVLVRTVAVPLLATLFAILPLSLATRHWSSVDRSPPNPLEAWGRRVLNLDLERGAAVLADSEKIAPLYYLQQTEAIRPDLDIVVLPDEAAYRAELDARLAAGQAVYLARFLPNLEGVYHLYSLPGAPGPFIKVSSEPLTSPPLLDRQLDLAFGPSVTLLGFTLESGEIAYPDTLDFTLYWTADAPVGGIYQVRTRLVDGDGRELWKSDGAHPADNSYPTSAWHPGEIVPDAHQVPWPLDLPRGAYQLQVALLPPYGSVGLNPVGGAEPWYPIVTIEAGPPREIPSPAQVRRIWVGDTVITGLDITTSARPAAELPVILHVDGDPAPVEIGWRGGPMLAVDLVAPLTRVSLPAPSENGEHALVVTGEGRTRCGWPARSRPSCALAEVSIQGVLVPDGATNFEDLIALLATDVADMTLQAGGTLEVILNWEALVAIPHDYTLFLHVLDAADRIVGQLDVWPVQGTYPTRQWPAGELIADHYSIPIAPDAAPGTYRLELGWYLLETMERLKVLAVGGEAVDDRVLLEGFFID